LLEVFAGAWNGHLRIRLCLRNWPAGREGPAGWTPFSCAHPADQSFFEPRKQQKGRTFRLGPLGIVRPEGNSLFCGHFRRVWRLVEYWSRQAGRRRASRRGSRPLELFGGALFEELACSTPFEDFRQPGQRGAWSMVDSLKLELARGAKSAM